MTIKNYYAVLGCKPTDSADTLRKAYRTLAKRYHPDLNPGDKIAETKMQEIGQAWEVLGDEEKRKKYDSELSSAPRKKPFNTAAAPRSNRPMTQEDFCNMSKAFDDMFSKDAIRGASQSKPKSSNPVSPMDTNAFFEQFMGVNKGKK